MRHLYFAVSLVFFQQANAQVPAFNSSISFVKDIPLPAGFTRLPVVNGLFAAYLRHLSLRSNNTVYLYNGQPKENQSLHYAVVDISTGKKDLQQCADVVMRLRAEYFYDKNQFDSITFKSTNTVFKFSNALISCRLQQRECFMRFMERVFMNCGTYSLSTQLKPVSSLNDMQIGDVLIKGGAPGHAEIVVDMAVHTTTGKKIYLLAEGYMPAQDTHIVLNPVNTILGPWFEINNEKKIITPTWIFSSDQLRRW